MIKLQRSFWTSIMVVLALFCAVNLVRSQQNSAQPLEQDLARIQRAITDQGASWQAGITPIARLTQTQRSARLGAFTPQLSKEHKVKAAVRVRQFPGKFDWRQNNGNWVTPIKDQGDCGSCWDFAAVGAFESLIKIAAHNSNLAVDLSEQFVLSCSDGSCDGWWAWRASEFLTQTGTPDEACMVYWADDTIPCSQACTDWRTRVKKLSGWSWVTTDSAEVDKIKAALLENPLCTHMDVYTDFLYYTGGVYEYVFGSIEGGHAVIIVGWDDHPPEGGGGCWIVKNSWDTSWGEQGYFRIRWGQSALGTWTFDQDMPGAEPNIAIEPSELDTTLAQGQATVQTLSIMNNGTATLNFNLLPQIATSKPDCLLSYAIARARDTADKSTTHLGTHSVSVAQLAQSQQKSILSASMKPLALPPTDQTANYLTQGFEEGIMPPTGWTKIDGASLPGDEPAHWRIDDTSYVYAGNHGAVCPWGYHLNEWLISQPLNLTSTVNPRLLFYWESSYYWNVSPNDNGDLFVKVSIDSGHTWSELWTFGNIGPWDSWSWHQTILDLSAYVHYADVRIAFNVVANDNGSIALDEISLIADSWIDIPQSAGYVFAGDTVQIPIILDTVVGGGVITTGDHYANIWVSSDDPDSARIKVPVHLYVNQADYAVAVSPRLSKMRGVAGDTLFYQLKVKNWGLKPDEYQFSAGAFKWTTSIWDSNGVTPLVQSGVLTANAELKFSVRVEIPADAQIGSSDTARIYVRSISDSTLFARATLMSSAKQKPGTIPWFEDFASTSLDTTKWCFNRGPAEVSTLGINEPSTPYALNLNGDVLGGDEIQSCSIDLSKDSTVIFSFYYERTGSGDAPESGEDLWVDYLNKSGSWIGLVSYPGQGPSMTQFVQEQILLPADAYHSDFKFRFRNLASQGKNDDWFVDNISLNIATDITVTMNPEPFHFNLALGDSTTGFIVIGNAGEEDLVFAIGDCAADSFQQASHSTAAMPTIHEILRANYLYSQRLSQHGTGSMDTDTDGKPEPNKNQPFSYTLEQMLAAHPPENLSTTMRACVIDGYGTYSQYAISTWDHLNLNWSKYGPEPIVIDYTTLAIDNFTYTDLVKSGADMLIISDNWGSPSYDFNLTAEECQAIVRYIEEGHGLYVSAGTFNNYNLTSTQPHVDYLAELVGINSSLSYNWSNAVKPGAVNLLEPSHPLFRKLPNPFKCTYSNANTVPTLGDWPTAISTGKLLAISTDNKTAIIVKGNRVYHSSLPESSTYGIAEVDYQFVYNVIVFSKSQTTSWLFYEPKSGTVKKDSAVTINVRVHAVDLIPDSTYARNILISSNDPDEDPVTIPTRLSVNPVDYYFLLTPTVQGLKGKAGEILACRIEISNFGLLADSYFLTALNHRWPISFWDSTGTTPWSQTTPVAAKNKLAITVKVEIPLSTRFGDADTAKIQIGSAGRPELLRFGFIFTSSVGIPARIPWSDSFDSITINPSRWIFNQGPVAVNSLGLNEPSPNYSMNLDGDATSGDEIHSQLIDLSGDTLIVLSYYYQRTGGGDSPETGEDLWIDYRDASENWINLKQYPGDGLDMTHYVLEEIPLPKKAYHNAFQIRFRSKGNTGSYNDDWFIDDVWLTRPPRVQVMPDHYDVKLGVGERVKESPIKVHNSGEGDLRYRMYSIPTSFSSTNIEFEPATRTYPNDYYVTPDQEGLQDTRSGAPVVGNAGGPDNFGYFWLDSDEAAGPSFKWEDISKTGTRINGLGDNQMAGPIKIGFAFPFYGSLFDEFYICSNGYIIFTSSICSYNNQPIPNSSVFNMIAPFWNDLIYDYDSDAYYLNDGKKLIIQSHKVKDYYYANRNTFEIQLFPDGAIKFQYLTMASTSQSATIGMQNYNGTDGLEIAFNTEYVHNQLAVLITNHVSWLELDKPSDWIIPHDSTDVIDVAFNAQSFTTDGIFGAKIYIRSNDPLDSLVTIPVRMTVLNKAAISGTIRGSGRVLPGATVQVWDTYPTGSVIDSTLSDSMGHYLLRVPPETGTLYVVRAFASGFMPALLEHIAGASQNQDLSLIAVPGVMPTIEWVSFFGANTRFWHGLIQAGDVITAEDPDSVVCGIFTVTKKGRYGFMPVYRDDDLTPDIDEGANPGDRIRFKINSIPANSLGPEQPIWSNHGMNLHVELAVERPIDIPLDAGWNLISWNVDTPVDSPLILLANILPNLAVVLGYENGGLSFDPTLLDFSTLKIMDHRHGYWMKMKQADTLSITGIPVDFKQTPIYCETGWNLVSYLPDYPDSVSHAIATVFDNTVGVFGFKQGGLVYDPDWPEFNTLNVLCPNYGYWLWLTSEDTLRYSEPLAKIDCPYGSEMMAKMLASQHPGRGLVTPGNEWINVFGKDLQLDGKPLAPGTLILAVDPDNVVCGETMVTAPGSFGFMAVYRDDPRTEVDEGARPGDEITFYINDFKLPVTVTWTTFGSTIDLGDKLTAVTTGLRTLPEVYHLSNNYPNPFNPETTIKYQLPESEFVNLKIYNVLGQVIRSLVAENKKAGFYQVTWDGRDDRGAPVTSGIYIYHLKAGKFEMTKKMMFLK